VATAYFEPGGWLAVLWRVQWLAGVIPVLILAPLLYAASREGKWPRRRTAFYAALMTSWALAFLAAQGLAMWALRQQPPALVVTAGGIWCAPWRETVRWEDVISLDSYDEKAGRGWRTLGVTLRTSQTNGPPIIPTPYRSALLRWGIRLGHGKLFGHALNELQCGTRGISLESQAAIRLIQEIHFKLGPRVDAKFRPRNRCWVDWCLKNKGLDHVCVANMQSDSSTQPCPASVTN